MLQTNRNERCQVRENTKFVAGKEEKAHSRQENQKQESRASPGLGINTTALGWHSRYSDMDPTLSIQTHFVLQPLWTAHTPATPNKSSLQQHTLVFHTAKGLAMHRLPLVPKSVLCLRALSSSKAKPEPRGQILGEALHNSQACISSYSCYVGP